MAADTTKRTEVTNVSALPVVSFTENPGAPYRRRVFDVDAHGSLGAPLRTSPPERNGRRRTKRTEGVLRLIVVPRRLACALASVVFLAAGGNTVAAAVFSVYVLHFERLLAAMFLLIGFGLILIGVSLGEVRGRIGRESLTKATRPSRTTRKTNGTDTGGRR